MNMALGHEPGLAWEWDSVLLLANPSLASHSLEEDGSTTFPGSSADHNHESNQEHNHDHCHDKYQPHESAEHMQTDSISSGSQPIGAGQEWRDPRLDCPNFLAGRVPCACTDNDEEDGGVSRKRSKPVPRCQVQSCGAELTNLKGYHQRHRVCLRCAHATRVMLRNQPHRYCQQCGKFHPICDFDEGKRSCRRKLERHNNRRRRKALESEDTLLPLDSSEIAPRSDSSPTDETSNTTKLSLFFEGEDKVSYGGSADFGAEQTLPPAVESPSDKFIASEKRDENVIVAMGGSVNMSMEALAPLVAAVVGEILPTSEPPTKGPEVVRSPEMQRGHKKDCLPHPEHVPMSRDISKNGSQALSTRDMSSHHIAPRDLEEAERLVRGNDEESLLALLMEDSSAAEGSGLSQNESVEVNGATHLWESSTNPTKLSKQANYSSPNPTGRISFKLYDWNPGDFPRQLRQQVMQWLSQMPVDLEGYIRSGCTILTLFVSMPQPMWEELNAGWTESVLRLVTGQGGAFEFWNTEYLIARVGQQIVHVRNGEAVRPLCGRGDRGPMLEGVHPICVEAGVEQEVVMSGSNLHQFESKLLVSFDGIYIKSEILNDDVRSEEKKHSGSSLQSTIPALHSQRYGTAFIEVEHTSGISNFIPLLIAEKKVVDEVRTLEQEVDTATTSWSCSFESRCHSLTQNMYHDLLVDLGWVLRNYTLSNFSSDYKPIRHDVERLQRLLHFGIRRGWCTVVERILQVAKGAGALERIGFLKNGMTALHVSLLHRQYEVMKHVIHLMASLGSSGSSGCRSWWDIDCPVSSGLTARQILAVQAKTKFCVGSTKFQKKIFRQMVGEYVGHVSQHAVYYEKRISSSSSESEVRVLIHSEADICSEDFEYRALPGEISDHSEVNVSGSTDEGEAKFVVPSADYRTREVASWKSLLRGDYVDTRLNSFVVTKRSACSMEGLSMYLSRASKRKPVYASTLGILFLCAGLCVMLQHPNQVTELSQSLQRCLWGLEDGPL